MANKGNGFGEFSQLADELASGSNQRHQAGAEPQEGPDLEQFSELMTDRSTALDTVARDKEAAIRVAAMRSLLTDTLTATVAEQEAISWSAAVANGQELPGYFSEEEAEIIGQLAMVNQARAKTSVVCLQSKRQPAISGLRSLPALNPVK